MDAGRHPFFGLFEVEQGNLDEARSRLKRMKKLLKKLKNNFQEMQIKYQHDVLFREILIAEENFSEAVRVLSAAQSFFTFKFELKYIMPGLLHFFNDELAQAYIGLEEEESALTVYKRLTVFDSEPRSSA